MTYMWTPYYFGVAFAYNFAGSGPMPPPTNVGTPQAANDSRPPMELKVAA